MQNIQRHTINGYSLPYVLEGPDDAPVLTFAHALSLNLRSWAPQIDAFKDRYRVLCYDIRGHAGTDPDGPPVSMEDLAGDVVALLDHLDIARTHFIGSSLGGMVGFPLALDHAGRLNSLTLLATQGVLPEERAQAQRKNIAAMRADPDGAAARADVTLTRLLREGFERDNPENYAALRDMVVENIAEGYERGCEAIIAMNYDDRLGEIGVPTLVVAGAKDVSTTPERMAVYRDEIAGARFRLVEGAGHFPNFEEPKAFNAILGDFLSEVT